VIPAPETPRWILKRLGASHEAAIHGGGSGASAFVVDSPSGRLAVKVGRTATSMVDGHGGEDLVNKWRQLRLAWAQGEPIRSLYAKPVRLLRDADQVALVCAYHDASSVLTILDTTNEVPDLSPLLSAYLHPSVSSWIRRGTPSDYRMAHIDRVRRRVSFVAAHAPEWLDVNDFHGVRVPNVNAVLALLDSESMVRRCTPGYVHFPIHGDMNLQNILWSPSGPKLIDVRGVTTAWDLVYDLGKMLFDVLIYHDLARQHRARPAPGRCDQAASIMAQVDRSELGAWLSTNDPGWKDRLVVTVLLHALSEAACRLSVGVNAETARAQVSIGLTLWCRGLHGLATLARPGGCDDLLGLFGLGWAEA
jgi:hypothetical protein